MQRETTFLALTIKVHPTKNCAKKNNKNQMMTPPRLNLSMKDAKYRLPASLSITLVIYSRYFF